MIYTATLRQFYFTRLAPSTHIYTEPQKKRKSRLPCACRLSPPPATATPSPSSVVRELVPRVARLFRRFLRACSRDSRARPRIKRGRKGDWQEQRLADQSTNRDPRETAAASEPHSTKNSICNIRPFCSPGLRPSLHPPFLAAYPPSGRGCATPPPPPSHSV